MSLFFLVTFQYQYTNKQLEGEFIGIWIAGGVVKFIENIFVTIILWDIFSIIKIYKKVCLCVASDLAILGNYERELLKEKRDNDNNDTWNELSLEFQNIQSAIHVCKILFVDLQLKPPMFSILGVDITPQLIFKLCVYTLITKAISVYLLKP